MSGLLSRELGRGGGDVSLKLWTLPVRAGTSETVLVWLQRPRNGVDVGDTESTGRRDEASKETGKVVVRHRPRLSTGPAAQS